MPAPSSRSLHISCRPALRHRRWTGWHFTSSDIAPGVQEVWLRILSSGEPLKDCTASHQSTRRKQCELRETNRDKPRPTSDVQPSNQAGAADHADHEPEEKQQCAEGAPRRVRDKSAITYDG